MGEKIKIELEKDEVELILRELLDKPFCEYQGDKEGLKNLSIVDVYKVGEDDWDDLNMPLRSYRLHKEVYYNILKQLLWHLSKKATQNKPEK